MQARAGNRHRLRLLALLPPGIAGALFIIWCAGPRAVTASLHAVGWRGLLAAAAVHLAAVALCALAWRLLACPRHRAPARGGFLFGRLIRDLFGELLPLVPLGEILAVRVLVLAGLSAARATAATIADITVELATELACAAVLTASVAAAGVPAWRGLGVSGIAGAGLPLAICVLAQRLGGAALSRPFGNGTRLFARIAGFWDRVEAELRRLYRRRLRLAAAAAVHLAAWMLGGLETWVILHAAGAPIGAVPALALEIAVSGVRNVSPVPGGAGVQEGGYFLLGGFLGLAPESAVALSLVRRARLLLCAGLLPPLWWLLRLGEWRTVSRGERPVLLAGRAALEGPALRRAVGSR